MKDRSNEEKRKHSDAYVPYTCYRCNIPDFFPSVPLHWHREFELAFIHSGNGEFRIGDSFIPISAGDIIIVKPGSIHSTEKTGSRKLIYDTIVFDESFLFGNHSERCYTEYLNIYNREDSKLALPIGRANPDYALIRQCTEQLFEAAEKHSGEGDFTVKIKLAEIFRLVLESGIIETGHTYELASDPVRPAIDYIRNNYSEKISVDTLAGECHLSKSYFMNLFKKVTGTTVIGYLMQVRIDKACRLLANENMTASETALSVGYTNISNFNRQFRQLTGSTPKEYKKRK